MPEETYPNMFTLDLYAMPCTNHCRHCWAQGDVRHALVPAEQVYSALEKLVEVKEHVPQVDFFLYDEPTTHPQFVEIMEEAAGLGLIGEQFALPTNGSVLARAPDKVWQRLQCAGVDCLQLTVYGLEPTHDAFAGRRGAFQNIATTIHRASKHGVECYVGVVLHADNVDEVDDTITYLKQLDSTGKVNVDCIPFLWQGRGRDAKRMRENTFARLPERIRQSPHLVEEREAVRRILESPGLAGRYANEGLCTRLTFQVDRQLRVFCGGACDSGGIAAAAPELADAFFLGMLRDEGFMPLLDAYLHAPPLGVRTLADVTWGELAERYGDRTNDEIYWLNDLPWHKWAAAYLLERLSRT